jgi:microcystin-dependent protein
MSEPFLSEIKLCAFNFAPKGWALCNGQFLPINQNQALFSLLGTTYGGNGQTTFQLPDLRGHCAIHVGDGHTLGERGGEEAHTVSISEMPQHLHSAMVTQGVPTTDTPSSTVVLANATIELYRAPTNLTAMEPGIVSSVGGSQAHQNMQPFTVVNFIIALQGIFPSQN